MPRTDSSPDISVPANNRQSTQQNQPNATRWRLNNSERFGDGQPRWDIVEEMGKMKIAGAVSEDDLRGPIRTPPKPRVLGSIHFNDGSPLDTSSLASNSPSPHVQERTIHSRGPSSDSSHSQDSNVSTTGHAMANHKGNLKVASSNEQKERPHSFSGGLSASDLRRLQFAGEPGSEHSNAPAQGVQRVANQFNEQPSYPSLSAQSRPTSSHLHMSPPRSGPHASQGDDLQVDYSVQQRNFNPVPQNQPVVGSPLTNSGYVGRSENGVQYRQPRGFNQQNVSSPTSLAYHSNIPMPLNNSQQVYDLMLPHEGHQSAIARVQQQHNIYRGGPHSAPSDPAAMREAAALALLGNNLQGFNPNMLQNPNMPIYANQFYGGQDLYSRQNLVAAQALAAAQQLPQHFNTPYGAVSPRVADLETSSSPSSNGQGPSANNRKLGLYKTELCRNWEEKGTCRYGTKCQFAHGEDELRNVSRHPKYKTEICRTFWVSGSCPYGKRCCFIHTELPQSGPPVVDTVVPTHNEGHNRSSSTTSDPNDGSVSLLARIKRNSQDPPPIPAGSTAPTPTTDMPSSKPFTNSRPAALRVVTALDNVPAKQQNKSAYPSFAGNGILLPTGDNSTLKSPVPVTAGPDLGGRNNFAYGGPTRHKANSSGSSIRNSFSGDDLEINYNSTKQSGYGLTSPDTSAQTPRANGHARTGSAGNWGSMNRNSTLTMSAYPRVGGETTPWSTTELAVGSSRLNEQNWA
jgi:hypothetical protein